MTSASARVTAARSDATGAPPSSSGVKWGSVAELVPDLDVLGCRGGERAYQGGVRRRLLEASGDGDDVHGSVNTRGRRAFRGRDDERRRAPRRGDAGRVVAGAGPDVAGRAACSRRRVRWRRCSRCGRRSTTPSPGSRPATAVATAAEVTRLASTYDDAGVDAWAYWVPSPSSTSTPPDAGGGGRADPRPDDAGDAHRPASTTSRRRDGVRVTSLTSAAVAGDEPVAVGGARDPASAVGTRRLGHGARRRSRSPGLWTCVHDGDCGVYAVGTAPEWRRRGVARALVEHALADARRRGASTASLQSTPMAVSLYRSLGFEAVGRYEEWVCGEPDEGESSGLVEPHLIEQRDAVDLEPLGIAGLGCEHVALDDSMRKPRRW